MNKKPKTKSKSKDKKKSLTICKNKDKKSKCRTRDTIETFQEETIEEESLRAPHPPAALLQAAPPAVNPKLSKNKKQATKISLMQITKMQVNQEKLKDFLRWEIPDPVHQVDKKVALIDQEKAAEKKEKKEKRAEKREKEVEKEGILKNSLSRKRDTQAPALKDKIHRKSNN